VAIFRNNQKQGEGLPERNEALKAAKSTPRAWCTAPHDASQHRLPRLYPSAADDAPRLVFQQSAAAENAERLPTRAIPGFFR